MSCDFDVNTAALHVASLSVRREEESSGEEGELISAHDSELIVRLWHSGPGSVSANDG